MDIDTEHCRAETLTHIAQVKSNINIFVHDMITRGDHHDASKLVEPEMSVFAAHTQKLKGTVYGTPEYDKLLQEVKPAIEHHYANNRHHPEHWPNGVNDMTLIDLLEMLADWKAATQRNQNGNIRKSIEINAARYKMSPQLRTIFENTVREYFKD